MAVILGQITCNEIKLLEVDVDPSSGAGTASPVGSLAFVNSTGLTYKKFGTADVQWTPTIFGENFQTATSNAESANTSTTAYSSKLTMTTPSLPLGNYRLTWGFLFYHGTSGRQVQVSTLRNTVEALNQILFVNSSVSRDFREGDFQLDSISGVQTFDLQFRTVGNGTANISNAAFSIWRTA